MKDKNCDKAQYTCGICKTSYDSIQERAKCELACVKRVQEEEKRAAEEKKKVEQAARKAEVDKACKIFTELAESYAEDYGRYEYEEESPQCNFWPNKIWHHFWF